MRLRVREIRCLTARIHIAVRDRMRVSLPRRPSARGASTSA
ncbi:hypothetical protein HMPREF3192_01355 [Atopobium deltae]|uniref:Uncharacterized protein n=1 Tax=Atopobium deltae TaxID=1393034 RepID=A0A133XPW9_9ACTN|nr:hypothetical protein HMPREF3192_01355 [Atopobium deltae]